MKQKKSVTKTKVMSKQARRKRFMTRAQKAYDTALDVLPVAIGVTAAAGSLLVPLAFKLKKTINERRLAMAQQKAVAEKEKLATKGLKGEMREGVALFSPKHPVHVEQANKKPGASARRRAALKTAKIRNNNEALKATHRASYSRTAHS